MSEPKKNTAFTFDVALVDASARPDFKAAPTLATGDFKVSKDGGAFANLGTLPTVSPAAGTNVSVALALGEMDADRVVVQCIDQTSPKEWDDVIITIQTLTDTLAEANSDTAAILVDTADLQANQGDWATATGFATPTNITAGTITTATNLTNLPTIPANWLTAAGTAADFTTEIQSGLATGAAQTTAQNDLDIITGATGVNLLAATQASIDAIEVDTSTTLQAELDAIQAAVITNAAGADIAADIIAVKAETANIVADTNELQTDDVPGLIAALNDLSVADVLTTQMTEAYAADGVAPTLAQALFLIQQTIGDFAISGTTMTVKKLDGSTTAGTYTLDSASAPTSRTRAT